MTRQLFENSTRFPAACCWLVAGLLAAQLSPHAAMAQGTKPDAQPPGNKFVKVRLAIDKTAVAKKGVTNLAIVFDIAPGWHLYWRNPGDSGLPPRVTFKKIDGVTFGSPQWPTPKRRVEADTLVDYVYEHQLVLLVPVTLDKTYAGGASLQISAQVDWLVCRERCVKGGKTVIAKFPVADGGQPSKDAKLFAAARARHPKPAADARQVEAKWHGFELTIRVKGATSLTFFPYENDEAVVPDDMVHKGTTKSDTLRLQYEKDVTSLKQVTGVLAITRNGDESFFEIKVNVPSSKK